MNYELKDEDYLELWKYFQERADKVKEAMFKTVTWTIGFAAAILGFTVARLTDFDAKKAAIDLSSMVVVTSLAGLVICLYSWFAISESAKHIRGNWERAIRCEKRVDDLPGIIRGDAEAQGKRGGKTMDIWDQLRIIVALFAVAFVGALLWVVAKGGALR